MSKVARLEQELNTLRREMMILRFDRDELYRKHGNHLKHCAGGDCCQSKNKAAAQKDLYIAHLEDQIKRTRLKYKQQMGDVKSSANLLESKLQKVRKEIGCITAQAREMDQLKKQVEVLKAKLQRRNSTIAQHSQQYAELMGLITNLDQPSMQGNVNSSIMMAANSVVSDGCGKDRKDSRVVLEKKKPRAKFDFVCLNAALRKQVCTSKNKF